MITIFQSVNPLRFTAESEFNPLSDPFHSCFNPGIIFFVSDGKLTLFYCHQQIETPPVSSASSGMATHPIRISIVGGHYLVFDCDDVSRLRREHNICGTLTGTAPQHPNQNLFFSLPVEIGASEASALIASGTAIVVNDPAAHFEQLRSLESDTENWLQYVQLLKTQTKAVRDSISSAQYKKNNCRLDAEADVKTSTSSAGESEAKTTSNRKNAVAAITLSSSQLAGLDAPSVHMTPAYSFVHDLHTKGYYTTPGLRFGAQLSVYPGDPLRFHAHFLANQYEWGEQVPLLDIIGTGRLATSVKKGFLFGACQTDEVYCRATRPVYRTFCVEWAGM